MSFKIKLGVSPMNKRIIPVVIGILRKGKKYLLTKRVQDGEWVHQKWQFPGGELKFGENLESGLKREFFEELGIRIKRVAEASLVYESTRGNWHGILICYVFDLKKSEELTITLNEEASEFRWFTLDEIMKLETLPKVKDMAKDAKK
jgi:8-oxo-dGTP diphosphatase